MSRWIAPRKWLVGAAVIFGCTSLSIAASAQQGHSRDAGRAHAAVETLETESIEIMPVFPDSGLETARSSRAESARAHERLLEIRETIASWFDNDPLGPPGLPDADVDETAIETSDILWGEENFFDDLDLEDADDDASLFDANGESPTILIVKKNKINDVVPIAPAFKSSLGEPAVANNGRRIFYTGNTFASFSPDKGKTWTPRSFPAAPFAGAIMCCDQDLEYSEGRRRVFWSMLWVNSALTGGEVQIAVLNKPTKAPACTYNIGFGLTTLPDYPHIGLSNDFLYLSTNNIDFSIPAWTGSQMKRFNLDAMADCQPVTEQTFTWSTGSQRVFVPVEGATDIMSWGILDNSTTFRIFSWPETTTLVSTTTRAISTSPHNNPDCRGGVGNFDFIERSTAWSIVGFRMRGWYGQPNGGGGRDVVGWWWNVGVDGSHPQGHVHAAVFDARTLNLVSQPHIFHSTFCFGYPDVATTDRGHPGVIIAFGGQAGGGGSAASNAVLLGDDVVSLWGNAVTVAAGTHNRTDGRFGDYFTIQRHSPCGKFFSASSYVLSGGTSGSNAEHHYVNFGRNRDVRCFNMWNRK